MTEFEVVYLFVVEPAPQRFRSVPFICKTLDENGVPYFIEGMNLASRIDEVEIQQLLTRREIFALPSPFAKTPEIGIYVGPTGHIFMAKKGLPHVDPAKRIIAKLPEDFLKSLPMSSIGFDLETDLLGLQPSDKVDRICQSIQIGWSGGSEHLIRIKAALLAIILDLENALRLAREEALTSRGISIEEIEKS
jgi:hypothetical protein